MEGKFHSTYIEGSLFVDFLRSNISLPYWKGVKALRFIVRLLNIQFKMPYLVSQVFVIFNQLSRV